tara:strand:+ start:73 stop:888 length:816 start_codon:yes stop_codon:yes gene_type:complete
MTRITVTEDTPLEVPLSELGWDEDGDELTFEISGSHNHLDVMVLTNVLRIVPSDDWTGLADGWYLTAISEDGNVTTPIEFEVIGVNDPIQVTWGPLETPLDAEFIIAIHDPDDSTPWVVQTRWDGAVWKEFDADCTASDPSAQFPSDWECKIVVSMNELEPGAHRLEARVFENGNWTESKTYYHTVPVPVTDSDGDSIIPVVDTNSDTGLISTWAVLAIVVGGVVALVGLYMIVTLSKDDMEEMLGTSTGSSPPGTEDDLADLESEFVEFD